MNCKKLFIFSIIFLISSQFIYFRKSSAKMKNIVESIENEQIEILNSTKDTDNNYIPSKITNILKKYQHWQSITISGPIVNEGAFSMSTPQVSKKWVLEPNGLRETSKLSVSVDCSKINELEPDPFKALSWSRSRIDFNNPVDERNFFFDLSHEILRCNNESNSRKAQFDILEKNHIRIIFEGSSSHVILFPSSSLENDEMRFKPNEGEANNIWRAPLGSLKEIYNLSYKLKIPQDTSFLHHNLKKQKLIIIDKSFPERYIPILKKVLKTWNHALKSNFFHLNATSEVINDDLCYSSDYFCLKWKGSDILAWTHLSCFASPTFDPETGLILGGILQCLNEANPRIVTPLDIQILYKDGFKLEDIAKIYLSREEFSNYKHPKPEKLLTFFLLHEFGHLNGFSHNLMGSFSGNPMTPSHSIMDYPPFPVIDKNVKIGFFDNQMINLVYKQRNPNNMYKYCGDSESETFLAKLSGVIKQPNCNKNDLGNPVEWFIKIAEQGLEGILTQDPYSQETVLQSLSIFLDPKLNSTKVQKEMVIKYFCSLPEIQTIISKVNSETGIKFSCENNSL